MNLILVAYRWNRHKSRNLQKWVDRLPSIGEVLVIENHPELDFEDPHFKVLTGSNRYAEFSGYLEGLEQLNDHQNPCLILNDTALVHHSQPLWCTQVDLWLQSRCTQIMGDPRVEPIATEKGPLVYYASWIFYLPNETSIKDFAQALRDVAQLWDQAHSRFSEYRSFINRYLKGSLFHGWKNAGLRDQKATDLKIRCIWAEHRLSQILQESGHRMQALTLGAAPALRLVDRFYSFRRRVQNFL